MTLDGIIFKVRDTDEDPLDCDLEIIVGEAESEYDDQPVGARIRGRGQSGKPYMVLILEIEDEEETVHFSVEALPEE
jgi:hypothetical protein